MWEIEGRLTNDEAVVMEYFHLKHPPMVKSLLDTDQYKKSMKQTYLHQFSDAWATWDLKARNVGEGKDLAEKYTAADREEIENQIRAYCALRYTEEELAFLGDPIARPWIHHNFIEVERDWRPHFEDFEICDDPNTGIMIHTKGVQWKISEYEIPVLEIVDETYYRNHYDYKELLEKSKKEFLELLELVKRGIYHPGVVSEFGARRRLSYEYQDFTVHALVEAMKDPEFAKHMVFVGTSNMYLAMKYNIKAVGTMAHEFIMTVGQGYSKHNPAYSNWYALDAWVREYGTMNGIALTDTIGTDVFLRDFKTTFARIFDGVRHDSGDPLAWGDKIIEHYKKLGIDPMTKTLLFSDSLDFKRATEIAEYFKGKAKVAFGIGTFISGPKSIPALNIVFKVAIVNGHDVAKLSDAPGKNMCRNPRAIDRLKSEIAWSFETGNAA